MVQPYSTVVSYDSTKPDVLVDLQADLQFRLIDKALWFREANIHVETNNANYGEVNKHPTTATAGDILTFQDFNLAELWFINSAAGSDTEIYLTGITMSEHRMRKLGLIP